MLESRRPRRGRNQSPREAVGDPTWSWVDAYVPSESEGEDVKTLTERFTELERQMKLDLDTELGPVDTGPDEGWWHIFDPEADPDRALCGEEVVGELSEFDLDRERTCPDCLRIARQRGLW